MVEGGRCKRLSAEPREGTGIGQSIWPERLDGDPPVEQSVARLINLADAPRAEELRNVIVSYPAL
jgi:hypothetical protein